jgi:hypothetical protein
MTVTVVLNGVSAVSGSLPVIGEVVDHLLDAHRCFIGKCVCLEICCG